MKDQEMESSITKTPYDTYDIDGTAIELMEDIYDSIAMGGRSQSSVEQAEEQEE